MEEVPKDIKKTKNKGQIWNQHYQISFEKLQTFAKNYFIKLFSPKFALFDVFEVQNPTLS